MYAPRLFRILCLALCIVGLYLAFSQLTPLGLTWDEYLDWRIAESIARTHSVFRDLSDPSQGRFAHLLAALSFSLFGFSYLAYKLPFVFIGCAGGVLLFAACRRRFSLSVALAVSAYYLTNPYVLGSMRTAATAGDVLVLVLSLAFVLSLERWLSSRALWSAGIVCAVVCGAATGAKWTNGLCVPLALVAFLLTRRESWAALAKQLACFVSLAALTAIVTNPTFLLGPTFVLSALAHAHNYDHGTRLYLGELVTTPQWYFVPAIFLAKYGIPFLVFLLGSVALAVRLRTQHALVWLSLVTLSFAALFALKPFQSAYYYIFTVAPCLMLVAWLLNQKHPWKHGLAMWIFLAAVLLQTAQALALAPDFLRAGAGYGTAFEGEFWGPAVNHCQGGPQLLGVVAAREPGARLYTLTDCFEILAFDLARGPVRPALRVLDYPASNPARPYVLAVHRVFFVGGDSQASRAQRLARFAAATSGCEEIAEQGQPYRIYDCR